MWHAWGEDRFSGGFWSGKPRDKKEADQLADQGIDGRIVLKSRSSGNCTVPVEWICLSQDREKQTSCLNNVF